MYAITRKVAAPARTSVPSDDPLSVILKYESRSKPDCFARRSLVSAMLPPSGTAFT